MENSFLNEHSVRIKLNVTPIYTLTGVKPLYSLGDMAYGQWLIYRHNKPCYYFNLFDTDYTSIKERINGDNVERFLHNQLRKTESELKLKQDILGIRGGNTYDEWITIEKLPVKYLT